MATSDPNLLVSTDWLAERLNAPDIRILDASYYLPGDKRNGYELYRQAHIPGARFFDIDDIADQHSPMPHIRSQITLPGCRSIFRTNCLRQRCEKPNDVV